MSGKGPGMKMTMTYGYKTRPEQRLVMTPRVRRSVDPDTFRSQVALPRKRRGVLPSQTPNTN